jgi:hypothetical protein
MQVGKIETRRCLYESRATARRADCCGVRKLLATAGGVVVFAKKTQNGPAHPQYLLRIGE